MIQIEVINPVDCQVKGTAADRKIVRGLLGFKGVFFRQGQYQMKRTTYTKSMMLRNGTFPTGLLPRLQNALKRQGVDCQVNDPKEILACNGGGLTVDGDGLLSGITLREDQVRLVKAAIEQQRGVILSPMGTGKTILMLHILAHFNEAKAMILVHNKTILTQTIRVLEKWGFGPVFKLGDGETELCGNLVVATRQSMVTKTEKDENGKKVEMSMVRKEHWEWMTDLDIVIIDEAHKFGDEWGQYATILRSTGAPVRLGFTATKPPEGTHVALALEGMVGPVIEEVTMKEGLEKGLLAMPHIELIPVKTNSELAYNITRLEARKRYEEVVQYGIIENRSRNRSIIGKAKDMNEKGLSVIIFVNRIEHGRNLMNLAKLMELDAEFVWQDTETEDRDAIAEGMLQKEVMCVIASPVWREGLNIPNLGGVIMAGGGKAELSTIQAVGRGLRRVPGKDQAIIVDLCDGYRYLAEHTVERIKIYIEQGWL